MEASTADRSASAPEVDVEAFRNQGYTVINHLFDPDEIETWRTAALQAVDARQKRDQDLVTVVANGTVRYTGDLLSIEELRKVLLDRRIIAAVRELLGGDPAYFGDSNVRIGAGGRLGWQCHRDDPHTTYLDGPNWRDPYPLVRCGLYLEDHADHSSGVGVIPGSQRGSRARRARRRIVSAAVGDLVAWDLRILHTGQMTRFRPFTDVAVHPRLGARLARLGLEVPEERERIALFLTFGLPGDPLTQFIDYLKTRDFARDAWAHSGVSPEVWHDAECAGLRMLSVPPFYGPLAAGAASDGSGSA